MGAFVTAIVLLTICASGSRTQSVTPRVESQTSLQSSSEAAGSSPSGRNSATPISGAFDPAAQSDISQLTVTESTENSSGSSSDEASTSAEPTSAPKSSTMQSNFAASSTAAASSFELPSRISSPRTSHAGGTVMTSIDWLSKTPDEDETGASTSETSADGTSTTSGRLKAMSSIEEEAGSSTIAAETQGCPKEAPTQKPPLKATAKKPTIIPGLEDWQFFTVIACSATTLLLVLIIAVCFCCKRRRGASEREDSVEKGKKVDRSREPEATEFIACLWWSKPIPPNPTTSDRSRSEKSTKSIATPAKQVSQAAKTSAAATQGPSKAPAAAKQAVKATTSDRSKKATVRPNGRRLVHF